MKIATDFIEEVPYNKIMKILHNMSKEKQNFIEMCRSYWRNNPEMKTIFEDNFLHLQKKMENLDQLLIEERCNLLQRETEFGIFL